MLVTWFDILLLSLLPNHIRVRFCDASSVKSLFTFETPLKTVESISRKVLLGSAVRSSLFDEGGVFGLAKYFVQHLKSRTDPHDRQEDLSPLAV